MRTSFMCSRVGGGRSSWGFFLSFWLLQYVVTINDEGGRFCSAGPSRDGSLQEDAEKAADFASRTPEDGGPSNENFVFRLPPRRPRPEPASSSGADSEETTVFSNQRRRISPPRQDEQHAEMNLRSNAAIVAPPQPLASIPVCVKPHLNILLNHAFDVLIYNQQRYLLTRKGEKTEKPGSEKMGENEGERNSSFEEENKTSGIKEVLVARDSEEFQGERLAEYIRMSMLLALMGQPYESGLLPGVPQWTAADVNIDSDPMNRDENLVLPPFSSSSLPPPALQNRWELAYARLISQLKAPRSENNQLTSAEEAAGLHQFSYDTAVLRDLDENCQIEELAALLQDIGRASLPNEPQKASVYLPLLTADGESMDLWRSHILRHVFERFTFSPCSPEKTAAATTATAATEAEAAVQPAAAQKEENDPAGEELQEGQGEEGVALKTEQKGGRSETEAHSRSGAAALRAATKDSIVASSYARRLRAAREGRAEGGGEKGENRTRGGRGGEEEKEVEGKEEEGGARREAEDNPSFPKCLLNSNWNGLHGLLVRELQQQFWMARPASSAAAVQMIQLTRQWQQQQVDMQGEGGQQQENDARGKQRGEQQLSQREEGHVQEKEEGTQQSEEDEEDRKDRDGDDLMKEEERGRSKSSNDRNDDAEGGAPWEAEISMRFRFLSMKDAQRMMGTFLTSNLHPEMGFPLGTKLPPKSRSTSRRREAAAGGAAKKERGTEEGEETDGDAEGGGTGELGETEQDEGDEGGEVPDHFDAREAFPACKEIIGHVWDQGECGSCWAFSSTTSFNDRVCIKSGGEMKQLLSPQHTTSCCSPSLCASYGCNGGEPGFAWRWFSQKGVVSGGDYDTLHAGKSCWPYEIPFCNHHANAPFPDCSADEGRTRTPVCRSECEEKEYTEKVRPFAQDLHYAARTFSFPTRMHAKKDLMRAGSISASFVVYEDFLNYKDGVYKHVYGLPLGGHAVKVIGWGVEEDEEYWLMINSWNLFWGASGSAKLKMGEAGVDDNLLAGDVVWKPEAEKPAREEKPNDVDRLPVGDPNVHIYREL